MYVSNLRFSGDGRTILVTRLDGRIALLSPATGKVLRVLGPPTEEADLPQALTPDGRTLVTAVGNRVQFWDVASGGEICSHDAHLAEVLELVMSHDGRTVATVSQDHTILVWDLVHLATEDPLALLPPDALWSDLAITDAATGRRAVETLTAYPAEAVALLRRRLPPAAPPDTQQVAGWIRDLGSDDYEPRQRAAAALATIVELAGPALRQALASSPSLETRRRIERLLSRLDPAAALTGEQLRAARAVQVLEGIGDAEALRLLQELARGAPGARLTEEAMAALARLQSKQVRSGSEPR
jgi:hypothetical protein